MNHYSGVRLYWWIFERCCRVNDQPHSGWLGGKRQGHKVPQSLKTTRVEPGAKQPVWKTQSIRQLSSAIRSVRNQMVKQGRDHFGVGVCGEDDPAGNRFLPVGSGGGTAGRLSPWKDLLVFLTISSRDVPFPLTRILYWWILFWIKTAASPDKYLLLKKVLRSAPGGQHIRLALSKATDRFFLENIKWIQWLLSEI